MIFLMKIQVSSSNLITIVTMFAFILHTALALFLLIFAFGVGTIPLSYAMSFIFQTAQGGFVAVTIISFIFAFGLNQIFPPVYFLILFKLVKPNIWITITLAFVRVVPIFSFLYGFSKAYFISKFSKICQELKNQGQLEFICLSNNSDGMDFDACCPGKCGEFCAGPENAFKFNFYGAGIELLYLFVSGFVFISLIILCESK